MRKILVSGLFACFLIGIIFFFFKFLIMDVLVPTFGPLILLLTGKEYLVIPLAIVFTFIVVVIVGAITTRIKFRDLYNRYVRKVPRNLESGRGAMVEFSPGASYLAVIIKEVNLRKVNGEIAKYYVLYCPSTPLPWSGLPVIYVEKEKVTPLKLSYGELYSIVGSFGANTPEQLAELKTDIVATAPEISI